MDQPGADANDLSIPDKTMFINTFNPQIVIARVTHNITGCFNTTPLEVEVLQAPAVVDPSNYELCDDDNDGKGRGIARMTRLVRMLGQTKYERAGKPSIRY